MSDKTPERTYEDGGPAFPSQPLNGSGEPCCEAWSGMSLRDYFAAKALAGIIASDATEHGHVSSDEIAAAAYAYADSMLGARWAKQ